MTAMYVDDKKTAQSGQQMNRDLTGQGWSGRGHSTQPARSFKLYPFTALEAVRAEPCLERISSGRLFGAFPRWWGFFSPLFVLFLLFDERKQKKMFLK